MQDSLDLPETQGVLVVGDPTPRDPEALPWEHVGTEPAPKKKGWMEEAALMFLAEMSMETIARSLGKSFETIAYLPRMPEFKALLAGLGEDVDTGVAEKLIRGSLPDSVLTIIALRDDPKQKGDLRFKCATYLIDRNLGKIPDASKAKEQQTPMEKLLEELGSDLSPEQAVDKKIDAIIKAFPELKHQLGIPEQ